MSTAGDPTHHLMDTGPQEGNSPPPSDAGSRGPPPSDAINRPRCRHNRPHQPYVSHPEKPTSSTTPPELPSSLYLAPLPFPHIQARPIIINQRPNAHSQTAGDLAAPPEPAAPRLNSTYMYYTPAYYVQLGEKDTAAIDPSILPHQNLFLMQSVQCQPG